MIARERSEDLYNIHINPPNTFLYSLRVRGTKTKQSDSVVPLTDLSRREVERWKAECERFGGTLKAVSSSEERVEASRSDELRWRLYLISALAF